jgi:hypothetical protein
MYQLQPPPPCPPTLRTRAILRAAVPDGVQGGGSIVCSFSVSGQMFEQILEGETAHSRLLGNYYRVFIQAPRCLLCMPTQPTLARPRAQSPPHPLRQLRTPAHPLAHAAMGAHASPARLERRA